LGQHQRTVCLAVCGLAFLICAFLVQEVVAQEEIIIERRIMERAPEPVLEIPPEERILTGEDDLVLLRRRKFFTVSALYNPRYTTNAFLTDLRRDGDFIHQGSASLLANTVIAERYGVYAKATGYLARYVENSVLDYTGLTGELGGQIPIKSYRLALGYRYNHVEDRDFSRTLLNQNELFGSLWRTFGLSQTSALTPYFTASRIWASPDAFTNTALRLGASFVQLINPKWILSFDAQGFGLFYDDFFESTLN